MRIDVILEANNPPETVLKLGRLAEEQGLGGVWVSNMNDARDPFINFVPLAMQTERIRLGPIAVSPFELHPLKMASSLLTSLRPLPLGCETQMRALTPKAKLTGP